MSIDPREGEELRKQAARCRQLADCCLNGHLAKILDQTAAEFEDEAERLDQESAGSSAVAPAVGGVREPVSETCG